MIHLTDDERAALLAATVALVSAVLGLVTTMFKRLSTLMSKVEESKAVAETVRYQVQNDHGTNLRDDIDRMHESLESLVQGLDAEKHYRSKQDGKLEGMVNQNSHRIARLEGKLDWLKEGVNNGTQ